MKKKSVFMGMIAISALVWMTGCAGRAVESSDIETEQEEKDGSGTASPCIECSKLIIQSGIKRVVYAEKYRLTDGVDLLKRAGVVVEYMNPASGLPPHPDWQAASNTCT